eukprot:GGOE01061136.1.p3 GENE.GGOE01061136.1~~GGOE01061136.1.p3  ORF type:complete len:212 (+),score=52.06 GGOE01061136.1:68-637(+)
MADFFVDTTADTSWDEAAVLAQFARIPGVSEKSARILYNCGFTSLEALAEEEPEKVWRAANDFAKAFLSRDMLQGLRCLRDKAGNVRPVLDEKLWKRRAAPKRKHGEDEDEPPRQPEAPEAEELPEEPRRTVRAKPSGRDPAPLSTRKKKLTAKQKSRLRRLAKRKGLPEPGPADRHALAEPPRKRARL